MNGARENSNAIAGVPGSLAVWEPGHTDSTLPTRNVLEWNEKGMPQSGLASVSAGVAIGVTGPVSTAVARAALSMGTTAVSTLARSMGTAIVASAALSECAAEVAGGTPVSQPLAPQEVLKVQHPVSESSNRLAAIARGEKVETDTHAALAGETPVVETLDFNFWYGTNHALHDVSMKIPKGKITAIIGPSGCGKSTLLRSINRLNDLLDNVRYAGDILLNGDSIYGKGVDVIELRKRMGMVFQKSNPFPMSIYENVVYPLRVDGERRRQVLDEVVERSLKGAALWEEIEGRLGHNALGLSGGQQQRLCIARAIAGEPEVLLMDEPCSALDPLATSKIEELMQELRGTYSIVIVTHNMQQAARVSDYTAFMYLGRLIEYGLTPDIFLNPHLPETGDYVTGRFG